MAKHRGDSRFASRASQHELLRSLPPIQRKEALEAERQLSEFQSRPLQEVMRIPNFAETRWVYPLGQAVKLDYTSDKDDPVTRDPKQRRNDPDGVQGVWKRFTHNHNGRPDLYDLGRRYHPGELAGEPILMSWPDSVWWLADLIELVYTSKGQKRVIREKAWSLWGSPKGDFLYMFPKGDLEKRIPVRDALIINGGRPKMFVNWRGVVN
jgi:hypothetical protein